MNKTWQKILERRRVALIVLSILIVVWNILLATHRKNLGGRFLAIHEEEVLLKVPCAGRIEAKEQQTIRAEIDGAKIATHVEEGRDVKTGDLLMEISDEKILEALKKHQLIVGNLVVEKMKKKKDYALEQSLFKQQAVPRREVENAREAYLKAAQEYEAGFEELQKLEKRVQSAKVRAPMDGVLVKNHVLREEVIEAGKELITIAKLDKFLVRGSVDELDIAKVQEGQRAIIKCDAFPDQTVDGRVTVVGGQAGDSAFAGIDVAIEIDDTKGLKLKPNLSAEASIVVGTIPKGIVVPARAVRSESGASYVLVKKIGGWLVKQPVKISELNYGNAVISSGLKTGESVLVPKEE